MPGGEKARKKDTKGSGFRIQGSDEAGREISEGVILCVPQGKGRKGRKVDEALAGSGSGRLRIGSTFRHTRRGLSAVKLIVTVNEIV